MVKKWAREYLNWLKIAPGTYCNGFKAAVVLPTLGAAWTAGFRWPVLGGDRAGLWFRGKRVI